jgi:two-component system sensor histidine kinase/response regulator
MSSSATLLLISGDLTFQLALEPMLHEVGYTLLSAHSAAEGLDAYARLRPDLVLLDVELVDLTGVDTCRQLVAAYGEDCAPVVFFAVKTAPAEVAAGFDAGAADYLAKAASADEIRARIQFHLQNHDLLRQQKAMVEQLGRANAAKNRFIGMAAHDMRNPLASIRGFAEFLLDGTMGEMPQVQLALVTIIHGTSNIMLKTLNELLEVATIEAGQLKLQVSMHSLVELVTKSATQAKLEARKKRTRIEFTPPAEAPVLMMDADKMKQVVDNLLSNAIKFSPAASMIELQIVSDPAAGTCGFTVRDQGPGIPDAERERLFKPFGLASEVTHEDKTAGLGLTICRNIVEAHGGKISAENLPDKGCEFRVTLPVKR